MNYNLNIRGNFIDLSTPKVMGIINITPDSFYNYSSCNDIVEINKRVEKMISEGADIIDIGALSTRPGSDEVSTKEETNRLLPVLKDLRKNFNDIIISIDTYRAEIVEIVSNEGADMINDISGGQFDGNLFEAVAKSDLPYILMHTPAYPNVMQKQTNYENILSDIAIYFKVKISKLRELGVKDIIIDPGFGFGKTLEQNYHLLNNLDFFNSLNCPILVGTSRKSMIYRALNSTTEDALNGTSIVNTLALLKGANILRVHDVKEAKEAIKIVDLYKSCESI